MKLIFITRIVDRNDTRSGFIFDWIEAFSRKVDLLYVICQEKGDINGLPGNVKLYSFGKENGHGRLRQLYALYGLLFTTVGKADGVLAHMHPIYAITAWLPSLIFGKKLALWYTHGSVSTKLKIALFLSDAVFTASTSSFRIKSKKVRVVGHGINLERFARSKYAEREDDVFRVVSVGRISPSKDLETLIKATEVIKKKGIINNFRLQIYGDPALLTDEIYLAEIKQMSERLGLSDIIYFHWGVSYLRVPEVFASSDVAVNLSSTGSIDKSVLEAAASKIIVLTSNEAFYPELIQISLSTITEPNDPELLAIKLEKIYLLSQDERKGLANKLYEWVREKHDLKKLVTSIISEF